MAGDTYNGYASRETWLLALWIDNTQLAQKYWAEQAAMVRENEQAALADGLSVEDRAVDTLAGMLEGEHQDHIDTLKLVGFAADLMSAAMDNVDWREVAEHLLSD